MAELYYDRAWLKSYDEGVRPDIDVPDMTCVELLEQGMNDFRGRAAFHFLGVTSTFDDLDRLSLQFANFLADIGCGPGEVVGISLPNSPQYLIALIGAFRAGCTVTSVSPLLSPKEMAYQLQDTQARALVLLDAVFEHKFLKMQDKVPALTHVIATSIVDFLPGYKRLAARLLKKVPTGKVVPVSGKTVYSFMELLRKYPARNPQVKVSPYDTCLIQYTGGTTGMPKGAEITHRNVVTNVLQNIEYQNHERGGELYCCAFPLFHIAGAVFGMLAVASGNTQVLVPDPRNTGYICDQIAQFRPTVLFNVPALYQMLLDNPRFKTLDFSALKTCGSAAAPLSPTCFRALESIVGEGKVIELYGMTETSGSATSNPRKGPKKMGSVGLPMPNVQFRLMDLDHGEREVPLGGQGEIIMRSPQIMKGYFNKPAETAYALRTWDGSPWLFSGDVGRMDERGYVTIVDRVKDMIIVGGIKVFSAETEETLYGHPAVEYCAIVAVPDPQRAGNERVKAIIQPRSKDRARDPKALEAEIIQYCRENMAAYKVPKIIEFVEQMPLTSVGKVDKKALR